MTTYERRESWNLPLLGTGQPALLSKVVTNYSYGDGGTHYESLRTTVGLQNYLNRCPPTLTILQINNAYIESVVGVSFRDNLTEINLNYNRIAILVGVQFPPNLTILRLAGNNITGLQGVQFPQTLTTLNLDHNHINSLEGVQFPQTLTTLDLGYNFITTLERIQFPPNLTELLLNDNNISVMSGVQFPNVLTSLNLSNSDERGDDRGGYGYNQIKSFNDVRFPPTLTVLNLQRNRLEMLGRLIDPSPEILSLIERQFPKIVEQYRKDVSIQSKQREQATLKEISDFNQVFIQNQIRGITSFLREGMEARAKEHAEKLQQDAGEIPLIYIRLTENGLRYPVPLNTTESVQSLIDYMNEHYYISSLVSNCHGIHLYKSDKPGRLDHKIRLADYGIKNGETINARCRMIQMTRGGLRKVKNKTHKKKWSMKYKRSINCRRPRGFSQRQHCKYGRRGWKTTMTRRIKSKSTRD
jgi:hypothetical protein